MKRFYSIFLAIALTVSAFAFAIAAESDLLIASNPNQGISFSDVDRETETGKAIYKLAEAGILVGDGDGTFRPNDPITRAELSKIVNAIFGYTQPADTGFTDMTEQDWYYSYVLVAKQAGYIVGFHDGTFRGNDFVSREQACTILCRVGGLWDLPFTVAITDPVSDWALPYVNKVLANAQMFLEEGNTFRATENITRAEFSVVFANFLKETTVPTASPSTSTKPVGGGNVIGGGNSGNGGGTTTKKPTTSAAPTTSTEPTATSTATTQPTNSPSASTQPTTTTTPTTPTTPTTTVAPTATVTPTTTVAPTTTVKPTTTVAPTTTVKPTTTVAPTTTVKPTTTVAPTTTVKPTTTPNYAVINYDVVTNLRICSLDLENNIDNFRGANAYEMLWIIKDCIDDAIAKSNSNIIDADFLREEYGDSEIPAAKRYYNAIQQDPEQNAWFNEDLGLLHAATINWLANEFGLI